MRDGWAGNGGTEQENGISLQAVFRGSMTHGLDVRTWRTDTVLRLGNGTRRTE